VLKKLAEKLGLAKLNFQVLRRTMATLAQTKGGSKDVQGVLGHSKADTTVNVYMRCRLVKVARSLVRWAFGIVRK
jgi:integrase